MSNLLKLKTKSKKRVGRGFGSGKGGHTVGRGTKGQKSRSKVGVLFEGVKVKKSLLKRLPLRRGKDKHKPRQKPLIIKSESLNVLPAGSKVNIDLLVKHGILKAEDVKKRGVKILQNGKVTKKLTILIPVSAAVEKNIKKAGGSVVIEKLEPKKEK